MGGSRRGDPAAAPGHESSEEERKVKRGSRGSQILLDLDGSENLKGRPEREEVIEGAEKPITPLARREQNSEYLVNLARDRIGTGDRPNSK
jgi:hypothetical protein